MLCAALSIIACGEEIDQEETVDPVTSVDATPVVEQLHFQGSLNDFVAAVRRDHDVALCFISATQFADTRIEFSIQKATLREVLNEVIGEIPALQYSEISGRFVLHPKETPYQTVATATGIQDLPRLEAAYQYARQVSQQVHGIDLVGPPILGDPTAPLYAEQVSLASRAPVLEHFVQLLGANPTAYFSVEQAPTGSHFLALGTVRAPDR